MNLPFRLLVSSAFLLILGVGCSERRSVAPANAGGPESEPATETATPAEDGAATK